MPAVRLVRPVRQPGVLAALAMKGRDFLKKLSSSSFLTCYFILEYSQLKYRVASGAQQGDPATILSIHSPPAPLPSGKGRDFVIPWLSQGWRGDGKVLSLLNQESHGISDSRISRPWLPGNELSSNPKQDLFSSWASVPLLKLLNK